MMSAKTIALALVLAACDQSSVALQTSQPGAPCGNAGVACFDTNAAGKVAPTGMCCWQDSVCGGGFPNVSCPAGECCFVGVLGRTRLDAGPVMRPQFHGGPS